MKNKSRYILSLIAILFFQTYTFAQSALPNNKSAVDNFMLSNGKIFVVIAVIFIIVFGLFMYLFSLDKKLAKLENRLKD